MSWRRLMRSLHKKQRNERICNHYKTLLLDCTTHINSLYARRYIFNVAYSVVTQKIHECLEKIESHPLSISTISRLVDEIVYSCGLRNIQEICNYLGLVNITSSHEWIKNLCTPVAISRERGRIQTIFFRPMQVSSFNSIEANKGLWVSIPGGENYHYAIKMFLETDIFGLLPKAFHGKLKMVPDNLQDKVSLIPEKLIVLETSRSIRSRIDSLVSIRKRLGNTHISKIMNEFFMADIQKQVEILSAMIIEDNGKDLSQLATLVYDIHANKILVSRVDVPNLIDFLPWSVKHKIRELRKQRFPNNDYEPSEIPMESRIRMLDINETTKQLALNRFKESSSRGGGSADNSTKAGMWVESFLKIPFGIIRKEPILCLREQTLEKIYTIFGDDSKYIDCTSDLYGYLSSHYPEVVYVNTNTNKLCWSRELLFEALRSIPRAKSVGKIASELYITIEYKRITRRVVTQAILSNAMDFDMIELYDVFKKNGAVFPEDADKVMDVIRMWDSHIETMSKTITQTRGILDKCVHKQDRAKEHVLRIMGQWMVGENSGYCLGFEGPPGVGKTTLAREGISKILSDGDGSARPFHMIALGTATTGSTMVGHNYTYQGSTYGDIVRILMESECMNPIIYIDELDKVSRTESGREIISILTHLTDPAQNEEFQDRYFAGVKLNLSRVLFVFSYNDPALIDSILLDRVHRIKFDPLTMTDKVNIAVNYTLPQICNTLRLPRETTTLDPEMIRYIVRNYTHEAGVRKLREILFDTFREVNLMDIAKTNRISSPTIQFVEDYILRHKNRPNRIVADCSSKESRVYGMFATTSGIGGILPIKVIKNPLGDSKSIKITGSLGDVMKESISVARSVACQDNDCSGAIHLHFPEGATPKDGPSAGGAIAIALYSHYNSLKVPGNLAITGEIDLDGSILPVGGIQEKLMGAHMDGITKAIIPGKNKRDYRISCENIPKEEMPENVIFVETFKELIHHVFYSG